ncbi:carboxypeptidase regulatory-like domain-containing protein [Polaribacter sp.]|uniref:carboxypeptidase regulatory-like domain-containing protein n=1 Tax=Polaribacter sp. TaxID=1920175 RepID=UPI00404814F4
MKKILVIAIFMVTCISTAQVKLTGVVKDSIGTPLEMANVIAIDDVSKAIASYGFSDAKGFYRLDLKNNTSYTVKISYIGFKEISTAIKTTTTDIVKNFTMKEDNMLDGINIVTKMPVTISGDTISYNADSFKNGTERKLEDVLKKLPGVEINAAGQIEVEGKAVEKITIDGKDFFSGDTKLASKNIPSNAIDKIQVLRNYSDVNQLSGVQNNEDRVAINIKLKEGKKNFWFGDVTAGIGDAPNESLYLFQPKLFYYTPKYTLNVIGDLNNIGEVVLDRGDLRSFGANFQSQSPSNGTNINIADAGIGFLTANARNANKIETKLSAFNFSYSPNKKLSLGGFLIFSSNTNGQRNINTIDYVDPNTPDDVVDNTTDQTSNTGLFRFTSIYKKDINNQMNYNIAGRFSNEFRTDNVNSQVLSDITERENATPFTINQDLSYFYTASETSIFALEIKHLLQDEDPFYLASLENDPNSNNDGFDATATTLGLDRSNMFYNLEQDRRVKTNQLDAKLDYYYILNSVSNLNFVAGTILSNQNYNSRFFQIIDLEKPIDDNNIVNPTPTNIGNILNPQITNDTEYKFADIYAGVRYRLKKGIFTITPGFTVHSYNSQNTQYGTEYFPYKFFKVLPEFDLIAQFKRSESLNFNYRQQVNFTDVNQIARGFVARSYNSFFLGNDELINANFHNVSLNYRSFNLFNNSNVFARLNYRKTISQVTSDIDFPSGSVVSISSSINSPEDFESFTAFANVSKTIKKITGRLGGNFNYNKSYQFLNGIGNLNKNISRGFNTRIGTNYTKAPNVNLFYSADFSDQENTSRGNRIVKGLKQRTGIDFDAYIWNSLTFKSDFSFTEVKQNGDVVNSFNILNASFAYRKNKDAKWEYELVGSNLLATSSNLSVNQNNLSFSINERFILPRFVSFRVRYQL